MVSQKIQLPRNLARDFLQYSCEQPEMKRNKHMKTIIHATRILAAFAALTLICTTSYGQRADRGDVGASGGNTGGGTVFYVHSCCRTMRSMNSDGTNKIAYGVGTYGPPSTVTFGGHRWFLNTANVDPLEFYPDGVARAEVFAFRDDYDYYNNDNSTTEVQLTNDITLQTSGDGLYSVHWVPGGQKISFRARRWNGTVVSEGGIYTGSLQFGPDGSIVGLLAQPTAPALPFSLDANSWPNVRTYGWDPAGSKIAYDDSATLGVADVAGSPHVIIYNGLSHTPQWSPDGTKIAFMNPNCSIVTIGPDGRGLKEIIRRTSAVTFDRPFWSPTGSHLVCYGVVVATFDTDLFRATSSGASLTNLTNSPSIAEMSMGWR